MRGRFFSYRTIGRTAGVLLVAAAIVALAFRFDREGIKPQPLAASRATSNDPLAAELAHCQSIGVAAQNDAACAAAWAENRRRFFTYHRADSGAAAAPRSAPTAEHTRP